MDGGPNGGRGRSLAAVGTASQRTRPSNFPATLASALRFPTEEGDKSLLEVAQQDLDATLQLLVGRAQYITGASGAAIALREEDEMVCRATVGASAPELGARLQMDSGLTGESIRTQQVLRCDNVETDGRVNQESCRGLGIVSVLVVPLVYNDKVSGVFELLSGRPSAFEERDIIAVQRLAEMVHIAFEHASAAGRAERDIGAVPGSTDAVVDTVPSNEAATTTPKIDATQGPSLLSPTEPQALGPEALVPVATPIAVGRCRTCGFPISDGRSVCLDCEAKQDGEENGPLAYGGTTAGFLSQYEGDSRSWFSSHIYLIGMVLVTLITIAILVFRN